MERYFQFGGVSKSGLGRGLGNLMGDDEPEEKASGPNPFTGGGAGAGIESLLRGVPDEAKVEAVEEKISVQERVANENLRAQRLLVRCSLLLADVTIIVLLGVIVLNLDDGLSAGEAVAVVLGGIIAGWLGFLSFYFD